MWCIHSNTCINDIFPKMILQREELLSSSPQFDYQEIKLNLLYAITKILTAVDKRDASVISKFPFSPNSAGTTIYNSETSSNSGQCYAHSISYTCTPTLLYTPQPHQAIDLLEHNQILLTRMVRILPAVWLV